MHNNFSTGEVSPFLGARVDYEKYNNGLKTGENVFLKIQGPLTRRYGKRFVAEVKTSSKKTRCIPFVFSDEQAYVIEFGEFYARFYMNGGRIESPPGTPVEIATPYAEADLFGIHYVQSFDTLYLFHQDYRTRKITRTSHTSWAINPVNFVGGPFRDSTNTISITPSVTTGNGTLSANGAIFTTGHVGALWEFTYPGGTGYVQITGFTSPTLVNMTVVKTLHGNTPTVEWREGMWSDERGYPATGTIFEQRLVAGGSPDNPQTIAASVSGDYENMTAGTADDDSYVYTIGSQTSSTIRWLAPSSSLLVGTSTALFKVFGGDNVGITPSNVYIKHQAAIGSVRIMPVLADQYVLFVQKSAKKLYQALFSLENDSYGAEDLLLLSEHLGTPGIVELSYANDPDFLVWAVRGDGVPLTMTYHPKQQVFAWFRHPEGSASDSVESICTIPGTGRDQTWAIVKRVINGVTKRYVEYYDPGVLTDSCLTYSGAPVNTVSGLGHLEGRTVNIVGDGAVYPDKVVTGGSVTLDGLPASEIQVGLAYTSTVTPVHPEVNAQEGTSLGRPRRLGPVRIKFYETLGAEFEDEKIAFRTGNDNMDEAPPAFTGIKKLANLGWGEEATYTIRQRLPLPFTVLGAFPVVNLGE
jgi:hypothetical protein